MFSSRRGSNRGTLRGIGGAMAPMLLCAIVGPWVVGCTTRVRTYECPVIVLEAPVDPQAVWSCNRDVMRRAAKGKKFSMREFEGAAAFFDRLTAIPADVEETHVGLLPGPTIRDDLRAWDAWHEANGERLFWNGEEREVGLRAAEDSG